jgi:RND family efflux transporter MFP subunit
VQAARVALSNARIVAPIAGRAGLVPVASGSVVSPTSSPLVTLAQLNPIAVAFSLPQRHLSDALASLQAGGGRVTATLPEGRGVMQGRLQVVDNVVDAGTGTVKVKALFDNARETLWPGAFVDVRLAVQTLKGAVVIPQAAIVQGARGRTVYVVDADRKAVARPVELVYAAGQDAVVTGVQPGERVIVEGRQNVRPGASVVERSPSAPATPASGKGGERMAAARP